MFNSATLYENQEDDVVVDEKRSHLSLPETAPVRNGWRGANDAKVKANWKTGLSQEWSKFANALEFSVKVEDCEAVEFSQLNGADNEMK
ncbi:hypothetical protein KGF57_001331 [Candida theae]|uniref:Uncharacterized protein n=1 Tax=Candida theae TaxID=1198502 RepID=A0AAD5BH79_9ASCO|nr:uncharacterized protein KGF57_001331 [Candida theae]KAI5962892.1 hypothetical protein KGF57_001331 [Candida theae]